MAADIDEETFVLVSLCDAGTETKQINPICEPNLLLGKFVSILTKNNTCMGFQFILWFKWHQVVNLLWEKS